MELKEMYENFDEISDPYDRNENRRIAIKPAWKSSRIFEPHSVTYVSPQPTDKFNFIAFIVLLEGIAMFLPSNMFINSETFFRDFKFSAYHKNDSKLLNKNESDFINRKHLIFYYEITSSTASVIAILFNVLIPISPVWSLTRRITVSIVFQALVISLIVILTITDTSEHEIIYLLIIIVSIILLNISNGIFQTCIHAMTAFLPQNYGRILMFGIYFGGVFMTGLQIMSIILIKNQRFAYIYFFVVSIITLLVCFDFYYTSSLSRFYRYFKNKYKNNICYEFDDFVSECEEFSLYDILSKGWKHFLNMYFVCLVTSSIYPSIQVDIQSVCKSMTFIPNKLLIPITSHLSFNMCSIVGCCLVSTQRSERQMTTKLWILSAIRILLIPFFVFCNLNIEWRQISVFMSNDFLYLLGNLFLGISNGYLLTINVINVPKCVKPELLFSAGMLSSFFIAFGLMSGSIVSFVIISFLI